MGFAVDLGKRGNGVQREEGGDEDLTGEGKTAPGRAGMREEGVAGATDALETHFGVRVAVGGEILRIMRREEEKTACRDEHALQNTRPHKRQWWRRLNREKEQPQSEHRIDMESGTQSGVIRYSPTLLYEE